ncbi:MAG: ABC transporter substrate-binding protein [Oscillospiraceae bacterium]|nr:ABC transporter substrate-binding protein [Oscillospiraceae bacterium]
MKHIRSCCILLVACLLLACFAGCGTGTQKEPDTSSDPAAEGGETQETGIQFTDMLGREIRLDEPADRIVVLTAADCEIVYALGAGDLVIGRGEYCNYPAEVLEVPAVQSGYETNIEQVIALQPDVLLMSSMDQSQEQVAQIEQAGITVVMSNADTLEGVYACIEMIGVLLGKESEAKALTDGMKSDLAELAENAFDGEKTVYFEVSPLEFGLWTAGQNTFMNEIATLMGLKNCFGEVDGWGMISEEQVLLRNPDVIVSNTMYFGEGPTPTEEILARDGWENVTAVQNEAVLNLQNDELTRPGPRLVDGARALYDFVAAH